jgi:ubiquinone/menaquinone biosynthesis C-methylase UbiE
MADRDAAFVGSIPANYDRYLGPLLFEAYADDVAERVVVTPGMRVLEIACGTGVVTERLVRRLGGQGAVAATDLNEPMIAYARQKPFGGSGVEWRPADGTKLPFDDRAFDAVVCQFGLMFFPDKVAGVREAFRVLKPGGRYLVSTWDSFAHNAFGRIAHETIGSFFPSDPPDFYQVPFSLHDTGVVRGWLESVGFRDVECDAVSKVGASPTAADAAIGLVDGNPVYNAIMQRDPTALSGIRAAVAKNLAAELGDHPMRCPLGAFVFSATRPR